MSKTDVINMVLERLDLRCIEPNQCLHYKHSPNNKYIGFLFCMQI